jgi:hypothetical protein
MAHPTDGAHPGFCLCGAPCALPFEHLVCWCPACDAGNLAETVVVPRMVLYSLLNVVWANSQSPQCSSSHRTVCRELLARLDSIYSFKGPPHEPP